MNMGQLRTLIYIYIFIYIATKSGLKLTFAIEYKFSKNFSIDSLESMTHFKQLKLENHKQSPKTNQQKQMKKKIVERKSEKKKIAPTTPVFQFERSRYIIWLCYDGNIWKWHLAGGLFAAFSALPDVVGVLKWTVKRKWCAIIVIIARVLSVRCVCLYAHGQSGNDNNIFSFFSPHLAAAAALVALHAMHVYRLFNFAFKQFDIEMHAARR